MKNKQKVLRHYHEDFVTSVTCDICKKEFKGQSWEKESNYDVLETEVKLRTGWMDDGGGSGEQVEFDICPDCFVNKLIPALKELGAYPTTFEWDR